MSDTFSVTLQSRLQAAQTKKGYRLPDSYHTHYVKRTVVLTCVATSIIGMISLVVLGILACSGHLKTLPQTVPQACRHLGNILSQYHIQASLIGGSLSMGGVVLSIGVGRILYRAVRYPEISGTSMDKKGKFVGNAHWVPVYSSKHKLVNGGKLHLDTSTLDENGTGIAYVYGHKSAVKHYAINIGVLITTPLYTVMTTVYYLLRTCVVPFYILGCLCIEKVRGQPLFPEQRAFTWTDIPQQMYLSVQRALVAPFYGIAFFIASLYALIDPLNGRKLGGIIERKWNGRLSLPEGLWLPQFPTNLRKKYHPEASYYAFQPFWKYEGGGGPDSLGDNGVFLPGCWQPSGVIEFKEGKIVRIQKLKCAVADQKNQHDASSHDVHLYVDPDKMPAHLKSPVDHADLVASSNSSSELSIESSELIKSSSNLQNDKNNKNSSQDLEEEVSNSDHIPPVVPNLDSAISSCISTIEQGLDRFMQDRNYGFEQRPPN